MVIRLKKPFSGTIERTERSGVDPQQLLWLLLLGIAYLLRDLAKLPMPDIVFTGLCAMAFLFLSTGSAMGVYMFTSALTVPDFEIRIVYLGVLVAKCILQRKKLSTGMILIVLGLALLEMVNMMLFSTQGVVSVLYTVAMRLTYFALPLFWFSENYSKEDYHRALLCYVAGVVLGGIVMLSISVDAVGWKLLLEGNQVRLGMNTTDGYQTQSQIRTTYNPNQLGSMFALVIATMLVMMDHRRTSRVLGSALVILSVFMVFLTKSRTAILLVCGIAVAYYFVLVFRRKKILLGAVFLMAIVLLIYGIIVFFPSVVGDLMARFQDEGNLTGGRDDLFVQYMSAWLENVWVFLLGYGIGSYRQMVSISNVPHNILADIVISWGLFGLVSIICILVMLFQQGSAGVRKRDRLLACLPALTAFIGVIAGQYISTGFPHMRLCFLLLAIKAFESAPEQTVLEKKGAGV